jgi:trigger factor
MEKSVGVQVPLYPLTLKDNTLQVTITPLSEVLQEAEIEVSEEELQPHFDRAYRNFLPKAELKGFRKGKVPLPMVKQLYGEAIERDALDEIATDFYRKAMDEKNIHPFGRPTMVNMNFRRGELFRFKIKYEVRPDIKLQTYRGVKVEKPIHIVTDAELEKEIASIRRANGILSEAFSVTDENFIVTADVQDLDEAGTLIIGKKTTGARFSLYDESLVPEIRAALAAAEVGQTYRAKFSSSHGDHTHPIHIALTVTKIEHSALPDFDDAFAAKVTKGKVDSAEELRKQIRADLERYWRDQSAARLDDNIARAIVHAHDFPVPASLTESILDSYVDDIRAQSPDKKLPRDFDERKFREESQPGALWQAKWMLLKDRIAEEETIEVTDADIDAAATRGAATVGIDKDRLVRYYRTNGQATERILSEKIMSFLREHAKTTEKLADAQQ